MLIRYCFAQKGVGPESLSVVLIRSFQVRTLLKIEFRIEMKVDLRVIW
jgi:hypothetical protein